MTEFVSNHESRSPTPLDKKMERLNFGDGAKDSLYIGGNGFYWHVGQGGYGIHTSDALAQAAAATIGATTWPAPLAGRGLSPADLAADRPTLGGPLIEGH